MDLPYLIAVPAYDNFVDSIPLTKQFKLEYTNATIDFTGFHCVTVPVKGSGPGTVSIVEELHQLVNLLAQQKATNWFICVQLLVPSDRENHFNVLFEDVNQALTFKLVL